jgi:tetratricopeptide (TPR) repeat protein
MHFKKLIQINAFIFIFVLSMIPISVKSGGNEENAIKLFNSNHYAEALPLFEELINLYPNDTILSYYTGVCMTETNHFGERTKNLLLLAAKGNVPANVNYYIGKNYQASNIFEPALIYYNLFKENARQNEIKSVGLKEKISMCTNRINPFVSEDYSQNKLMNKDSVIYQEAVRETVEENGEQFKDSLNNNIKADTSFTIEIPSFLNDSLINFNLTSDIYYTKICQFKTKKGKQFFIDGWKNSEMMKKLISETDSLRNEYSKMNLSENKASISSKVIDLENQIISTKSATDIDYMKASESELAFWNRAPESEKFQLIAENDSIKLLAEMKAVVERAEKIIQDTIVIDTVRVDSTQIQTETPFNEPVESGKIVFKVQIGAYNTELPESAKKLYKKISMLRTIVQFTDDRNYTIYTIGELTNVKDAIKLQEQIRQESVKDAFVIAFKDGKRIPLNEALESTK